MSDLTPTGSPSPETQGPSSDPTPTPPASSWGRDADEDRDPFRVALDIVKAHKGEVWRDPDGREFITLTSKRRGKTVTDHYPIRGSEFRTFIQMALFDLMEAMPSGGVLEHVTSFYEGRARQKGPDRVFDAFVRIAVPRGAGTVYLDLANEDRQAVEITASGVQIKPSREVPVKFIRPQGMLPLPSPEVEDDGSALLTLREIAGLDDDSFALLLAFLVGCANPARIYPLLLLQGGMGSGKSTLALLIRMLLDPQSVPLSAQPSNELDLLIAASNRHLLVYDNLSGMKPELSDALCRLSTGGGLVKRRLFTDREEERFTTTCPVALNGIDDLAERNDLADRSIVLFLSPIPETKRQRKELIERRFEESHPAMLGALCRAWSTALRRRDEVILDASPRMADFAHWVVAAEPALPISKGSFLKAYRANITSAAEANVELDPLSAAVVVLMADKTEWVGSMTDLLRVLTQREMGSEFARWTARKLASALRRAAPALGRVGISVHVDPAHKDEKRRQLYVIRRASNDDT